ncbi:MULTISPECIES: hypothetical protein [unclassified Crossiella]|uniref:hypothetical protein n=1 Tax=unclassified Crossiella TaxID=2620835 RepID=UPI0020000167|nr:MULTISPECIES: hypothetical protein [unclassified Crossiella]MCK2240837.1 hypothetical protein [Crossiella sp. S99.2]MCK2254019.1 hypothetical protein [Crossiella sp. S99.1]
MQYHPVHFSIVVVDIAKFGTRDDRFQLLLRSGLAAVLKQAFEESGIDWDELAIEDRGDGKCLLIPASVSKVRLLDPLISRLAVALRQHNQFTSEQGQIRLRMSVHAGEVHRDRDGWSGTDLNFAFRLVGSEALYEVLAAVPEAELVVIVSEAIHNAVVRHGYGAVDPASFHQIEVQRKEVSAEAWVHVPGILAPLARLELDSGGSGPPAITVRGNVNGDVVGRDKHVGGPW